ncbi:recombinase family protein [Streptomyces beihaiensis]|uniref:Recombinase family protein n=1 Tax=Streptomyces beihaiensis TaxID=2984495 RepID=A0ABT3U6D6_9ACTN|nr:recombinase family protein [Streptomyces beihaiensis]MCX3064182.1 recombinase family protein [Streptomyces beihaiensis]
MTTTDTLLGREYLRVSFDRSGYERSNEDQHADNADAAEEFNITLGQAYRDVGSASRFAAKKRDDFQRLMRDLHEGTFGAQVLQMWENSRGSRKPREWLDLIDACQAQGIKILITTHRRLYNLDNWRDRHALQEESLKAAAASEETSERVSRTLRRNAEQGRPHGLIPYGYRRTYTKVRNSRGRLVTRPQDQLPEPTEALNVINLFVSLRAAKSFRAISDDWAARGIVSRDGVPFSPPSLSQMARKISYIGKRIRTKTVRDQATGKSRKVPLGEVDAAWPVVADFEGSPMSPEEFVTLFHEVQGLLNDPQRNTNPGGGAKHDFTMTMRCNHCGGPMTITMHKPASADGAPVYICRDGGCTYLREKDELDAILTGVIVSVLARSSTYERLGTGTDTAELRTIRAQLTIKRAALEETRTATPETLVEERRMARREERLETEVQELEQQEQALSRPNPLETLFPQGPADSIAARWKATDVASRRAIVALLLSPEAVGQVRIRKAADSPSEAVADRICWVRVS